jgi:flagellar basal-body rod protein FlgG
MQALLTASTGMTGEQTRLDVIANNLANMNTPGFKAAQATFQDLVYQTQTAPGATAPGGGNVPSGVEVGLGTKLASTSRVFTQGSLEQTGSQTNLAISGAGFFQVTLPDGTVGYTRDGSFQLSGTGQLVTSDGYLVQPAITSPANVSSISIGSDGTVSVTVAGQTAPQTVGQLQLAQFQNPAGLAAQGQNLFTATEASGAPVVATPGQQGLGTLSQGYVEESNVSLTDEMVNLIDAERAYEAMAKVVSTGDQMLQMANQMNG